MRTKRLSLLGICAATLAAFALPSGAQAATCSVPGSTGPGFAPVADFADNFSPTLKGSFVELPVTVPANTKAIRVRYCYEGGPPAPNNNTVDIGVYEPGGGLFPGTAQRRGWSGSAVKDIAISENGFSPPATYNVNRKAYVAGYTTRAYQPGPIPAGTWNVELGMAALEAADPDGVYVHVIVETSSDAGVWANDPYVKAHYSGASQNSAPGWYTGDLHVHGEQEPGNTPVADSLNYAFSPISSGGAGLDFVTLIDHNNDIGLQGEVGKVQGAHPGKLVIPGVEVTTYNGHFNNQAEHAFVDYRAGSIYRYDGVGPALTSLRGPVPPAAALAESSSSGGWSQINHPTTLPEDVYGPLCRGCAWTFSDADTNYGNVDAIEVQNTGSEIAGQQNPFTASAIAFYQHALNTGAHIAAVGSSDYHKTGDPGSVIGAEATTVYANALSEDAVTAGVKADHTYVKFYGPNGPDVRFTADVLPADGKKDSGQHDAMIGDSLSGPAANLGVQVLGAGPSAPRAGTYELQIQRNGETIDTSTVSGDDFSHSLQVTDTGRYQVAVFRTDAVTGNRLYEVYTSPIWFTRVEPSRFFRLARPRPNRRNGSVILFAAARGPGKFTVAGRNVRTTRRIAAGGPAVGAPARLVIRPRTRLVKLLRRRGHARIAVGVTFTPAYGTARTARRTLPFRLNIRHHRR